MAKRKDLLANRTTSDVSDSLPNDAPADITLERAASEMEASFFAASIDLLCFLHFDGIFRRINPAWERTLGYSTEELLSRPFIDFVHPDDRARTIDQNNMVQSGAQARGFENRYICKDGSYRWLRWNAVPDLTHRVIYAVARDITIRKQLEAEREQLVRELQSALAEVKSLQEILPICSYCKKVRDDKDYWLTVEHYLSRYAMTKFSHGICPDCMKSEFEPQLAQFKRK